MLALGYSVFMSYTAGFALVGLISFYLIAKIIDILKMEHPWKSLILFPFVVALILLVMLIAANVIFDSTHDLNPYFLVAMTGFPTGWFVGLMVYTVLNKIKKGR